MTTLMDTRSRRSAPADAVYLADVEPPAKGQRIIYDGHPEAPKGFAFRITDKGARAFILRYKVDGRDRRMTVGEYPTWSLAAARARAVEIRQDITRGADPLATKRERREALTVAEAVQRYDKAHLSRLRSAQDAKRYFDKDVLPDLGKMKVCDVRRADVVELVEQKAQTAPRSARALLAHLKHFLAWCELREIIEISPAHGIKPAAVDRNMTPSKRGRVLDDAEIRAFWTKAGDKNMHKLTAIALQLVLLTGQRPGEVAGMHSREIRENVWTVPASRRGKTSDDHAVPLTETALDLLKQAVVEVQRLSRRRDEKPSGFVFEMKGAEPITVRALAKAVERYRTEIGNQAHPTFGHWTPHDLRRTCRTGLAAEGIIAEIAERVVGHVQNGMIGVYDQHRYDQEKRAALEAWERRLLRIVEAKETTDNVVPLQARKRRAKA
jgi:integrase